jgi:hypothetical protein
VKRHEWKGTHGYRKAFKSRGEQVMRPANVEILMGHDIGISESYWRPTEHELLEDYLKAVPLLTILGNSMMLEKKIEELTEKSKDENYIIEGRLSEKDLEIAGLKEKYDTDIASLKEAMSDMQQLLKNP